jgi:hypothetical protein
MSATFAEVAQRNMDIWQQMQNSFFNAAGVKHDDEKKTDDD